MSLYLRLALAALCIVSVASCDEVSPLQTVCPATCYSGPAGTAGVGECRSGTPTCDDRGDVLTCDDRTPGDETTDPCDGLDNNCNGEIDEALIKGPFDEDNPCEQQGKCAFTYYTCMPGGQAYWYCDYPDGPPEPEICDGINNDCDALTDEEVYDETSYCYPHEPVGTAGTEPCHPGVWECVDGVPICPNSQGPEDEVCDFADNDCDGIADDVENIHDAVDIVIAVDDSGTMQYVIDAVAGVVCRYANAATGSDVYRIALVAIARPDNEVTLVVDLGPPQEVCDAMQTFTLAGAAEPTISAAMDVADFWNPLGLSWRFGGKRIFIGFGDEEPQSYNCDKHQIECNLNLAQLTEISCTLTGLQIYWFARNGDSWASEAYQIQSEGCGGQAFDLSTDEDQMSADLDTIIQNEICAEEGVEVPDP